MEISLLDLYRIGRNAVQLHPAQSPVRPCLQLQAFRVLQRERGTEVGTDNLGALPTDKDNPFFWSRKWHNNKYNPNNIEWEWPLFTMFELVSETTEAPFSGGFGRCYTLELSVLDIFKEDCCGPGGIGCDARPINQIFLDTETLLDSVLRYFGGIVIATTTADPVPKIYYRPWLVANFLPGQINIQYELLVTLNTNNKNVRYARVERPTQKIYGTKTQVKFCTKNCGPAINFDLTLPDFGLLSFESGCKNC